MDVCFGHMQKSRNRGLYVIQRMKFNTSLVLTKLGPPKYAQTKVNRCRIQSVHVTVNFDFKIGFVTTFTGFLDQNIGKLLKNLIAAFLVCLAKIPSSYRWPKAKMIVLGLMSFKTQHQIPHAVPWGELSENHTEHLIPAWESSNILVSFMILNDTVECLVG